MEWHSIKALRILEIDFLQTACFVPQMDALPKLVTFCLACVHLLGA